MGGGYDIRRGSLDDVLHLHRRIPELRPPGSADDYRRKIDGRDYLALIAEGSQGPAGFKLGYGDSETVFYSWLGGVDPDYRGQGIAQALLWEQERSAAAMGHRMVRVKSMNRYPAMLHLLLSNGYLITGYEDDDDLMAAKIVFSKKLS